MGAKNEMTRKEFLVLTFPLVGSAAAVANCDDDSSNATGTAGSSGGGTTGTAGRGGTTGTGGGSAGTTGTAGAPTGSAGTTGTGGTGATACMDPLPEAQVPDQTQHTHHVVIAASALNAGTAQTFNTDAVPGHMHAVTLQPSDLTTLKGGASVMVTSSSAGAPAHTHMYMISCH